MTRANNNAVQAKTIFEEIIPQQIIPPAVCANAIESFRIIAQDPKALDEKLFAEADKIKYNADYNRNYPNKYDDYRKQVNKWLMALVTSGTEGRDLLAKILATDHILKKLMETSYDRFSPYLKPKDAKTILSVLTNEQQERVISAKDAVEELTMLDVEDSIPLRRLACEIMGRLPSDEVVALLTKERVLPGGMTKTVLHDLLYDGCKNEGQADFIFRTLEAFSPEQRLKVISTDFCFDLLKWDERKKEVRGLDCVVAFLTECPPDVRAVMLSSKATIHPGLDLLAELIHASKSSEKHQDMISDMIEGLPDEGKQTIGVSCSTTLTYSWNKSLSPKEPLELRLRRIIPGRLADDYEARWRQGPEPDTYRPTL